MDPQPSSDASTRRILGRAGLQLPWEGRATTADKVIVAGIGLRGLYGLAMLPLIPLLLGPHPLLLELLSGSTAAEVVVGARVRLGEVSWPVAILAGLPVWVLFDWLYWWAGRRWGDRALTLLLARGGRGQPAARAARVERLAARFGPMAVVLAWFLPVPSILIYAAAGLAGMRLTTFLVLDVIGTSLAAAVLVLLGYLVGQRAVDLVDRFDHWALVATIVVIVVLAVGQVVQQRRAARTPDPPHAG